MPVSFASKVSVPSHVLMQEMPDGDSVFINLETEQYFGLDEVGTRMWNALVGSDTVAAAYETLLGEYEVEPDRLRADMESLVDTLFEHGLLEQQSA